MIGVAVKIQRFLPSDADRIAKRASAALNEIQAALSDVHHHRSRPIGSGKRHFLPGELWIARREIDIGDRERLVGDSAVTKSGRVAARREGENPGDEDDAGTASN